MRHPHGAAKSQSRAPRVDHDGALSCHQTWTWRMPCAPGVCTSMTYTEKLPCSDFSTFSTCRSHVACCYDSTAATPCACRGAEGSDAGTRETSAREGEALACLEFEWGPALTNGGGGSASGTHLDECAAAQLSRRLWRVHEVVRSLQGKGSAATAEGSEVARRGGAQHDKAELVTRTHSSHAWPKLGPLPHCSSAVSMSFV